MFRTDVQLTVTKEDCGDLLHLFNREGGFTVSLAQVEDLHLNLRARLQDKQSYIARMEAGGVTESLTVDPRIVMERLRTRALFINQQEQVVSQIRSGLELLDQWRGYLIEAEKALWALKERWGYADEEDHRCLLF